MGHWRLVLLLSLVACSSTPTPKGSLLPIVGSWQYIPPGIGEPGASPGWAWNGSRLFALGIGNAWQTDSAATLLDPATGVWTATTSVGAPTTRGFAFTTWTGKEVFVWSGQFSGDLADGALYDPATGLWRPLPAAPIAPRHLGTTIWTGTVVIVWGGTSSDNAGKTTFFGDGAKFDPANNSWSPLSLTGAPAPRNWQSAVWTGQRMMIWGGQDAAGPRGDGAAYDPVADAWTPMSVAGAPGPRIDHAAVWTGTEMIVLAGSHLGNPYLDGGRYDPVTDSWTLFKIPAPNGFRTGSSAAWTGSQLITWGWVPSGSGWGGVYDPQTGAWQQMASAPSQLAGRTPDVVVWTGSSAIVYGGEINHDSFSDGALFTP